MPGTYGCTHINKSNFKYFSGRQAYGNVTLSHLSLEHAVCHSGSDPSRRQERQTCLSIFASLSCSLHSSASSGSFLAPYPISHFQYFWYLFPYGTYLFYVPFPADPIRWLEAAFCAGESAELKSHVLMPPLMSCVILGPHCDCGFLIYMILESELKRQGRNSC